MDILTFRDWSAKAVHSMAASAAHGPSPSVALDAIFFDASNTKAFANDDVRAAFRERWLGRYLTHFPDFSFVALDEHAELAGYVVGAASDPALLPLFDDIAYFQPFRSLTANFPAHLHVNVAERFRNRHVGRALVEHFADAVRAAGACGVHVVTSRGARNVRFYERGGFSERGAWGDGEREVVFLGKVLR